MPPIRIVVTGATGFIGHHVYSNLIKKQDIEVIGVTRRGSGNFLKVENYHDSPVGDILIHLAQDNRLATSTTKVNLEDEKLYLDTMSSLLKKKYSRIVYVSSGALYGDSSKTPHIPNDEVFISSSYTRVKYLAENAVINDKNGIVARLGNVYGFGMSGANVLSRLLEQIESQGDLRVADIRPIRDFIWVEDVVEGILSLALADFRDFRDRRIYNLGTGIGTSIGDLACLVLDIAGQTERHVVSETKTTRESSVVLDFSDTTRACGWIPITSLRSGISQLLNVGGEVKSCRRD